MFRGYFRIPIIREYREESEQMIQDIYAELSIKVSEYRAKPRPMAGLTPSGVFKATTADLREGYWLANSRFDAGFWRTSSKITCSGIVLSCATLTVGHERRCGLCSLEGCMGILECKSDYCICVGQLATINNFSLQ